MHGADMMYSEFISSEGLIRDAIKSRMKLDILIMKDLLEFRFLEEMRGNGLSSKIVTTVRPDIVDINFGCPVKKVVCKGAGAGVLKDVDLMIRLTKAVINSTDLPVTVKTRLGWDDIRLILMRWQSGFKISGCRFKYHARTRSNVQRTF
jgi:tRNA-dihydrouridine synthase